MRRPFPSEIFKFKNNKTYIFPTGFGFAFGALLFILLLMAIGYANNLIYLYVFGLISIALTSMYLTNKNISRLKILKVGANELYAEEDGYLLVEVTNTEFRESFELTASVKGNENDKTWNLIPRKRTVSLTIPFSPKVRGWHSLPAVQISSDYPFGLLTAWKTFRSSQEVLVYPPRKGQIDFPVQTWDERLYSGLGLFRDHRAYQSSDSPRRIDWRASSRTQTLLTKNYEGLDHPLLHFHWDQTRHLISFESRLAQLSLWIHKAYTLDLEFILEIGKFKSSRSRGDQHFRTCMEFLSILKPEDVS